MLFGQKGGERCVGGFETNRLQRQKTIINSYNSIFPSQSHLLSSPASVYSPVTIKCGRRGLVSSTPTFFAAVPASSVPRHTALAQFRYTPAPQHPAPPHEYGGRRNRFFHSGGTHGTHIPHDSCRSSSES